MDEHILLVKYSEDEKEMGKLWPTGQTHFTPPVLYKVLLAEPHPFISVQSLAAFMLRRQS